MNKLNLFSLCIIFILGSCSLSPEKPEGYEKDLYSPTYSKNFKIQGNENNGNVLISVFNPWQGSQNESANLLIVRDSVDNPDTSIQILLDEAKRIICMSSTHIAMLDALNATDRIVGVSGKEYITNPKIISSSRFIPDVGYEGNMDYEAMVAAKPDLVLLFSVNGASSLEPKLKELKIPFLYIGDYVEEDPLGKAEWIIPLAETIGKRDLGKSKFEEISERYTSLKDKVKDKNLKRPKVMVNAPFVDSWFMPSTESYIARMIDDAGGDYVYKVNSGNASLPIDMEEALKYVNDADVWINIGTVKSLEELKKSFPKFKSAECVMLGNLYNNNLRSTQGGGNDCYESGVVNPDIVLRDMIKIFHPELIEEDFTYYHKLQ